jgi:hypothetical protein
MDEPFRNYLSVKGFNVILSMSELPKYIRNNAEMINSINIENFQRIYRDALDFESQISIVKKLANKYLNKTNKIDKALESQRIRLSETNGALNSFFIELQSKIISKVEWLKSLKNSGIDEIDDINDQEYEKFRAMKSVNFDINTFAYIINYVNDNNRKAYEVINQRSMTLTEMMRELNKIGMTFPDLSENINSIEKLLYAENLIINSLYYNGKKINKELNRLLSLLSEISSRIGLREAQFNNEVRGILSIIADLMKYNIENVRINHNNVKDGFEDAVKLYNFFKELDNNWQVISRIIILMIDNDCVRNALIDTVDIRNDLNEISGRIIQRNYGIADYIADINQKLGNIRSIDCNFSSEDYSSPEEESKNKETAEVSIIENTRESNSSFEKSANERESDNEEKEAPLQPPQQQPQPQPYPPPQQSNANQYPESAYRISVIGGIFVILGGMIFMAIGIALGGIGDIYGGIYGVLGIIWGIIIIVGAMRLKSHPNNHVTWGIIILIFSIISWFGATGGLFIGFILGVIGGILAIVWHPPMYHM